MNGKGSIKRVFPGSNTAEGFYSYYDYIIDKDAARFFIIKGGPGVGKSYFIKKVGYEMLDKGYDVEFHHCSSDSKSLDGLAVPDLKIAIIDGTAPHVVDPKYPGAVDEILYFGAFWNEDGILEHKNNIMSTTSEIKKLFNRAYRFLGAAKLLRDDREEIYKEALNAGEINLTTKELIKEILGDISYSSQIGRSRHLFGSAYTPDGLIDYYETIIAPVKKVVYVDSCYIQGLSQLMGQVAEEAINRGLFVEVYHEPMVPTNIETVVIPQISVAITASDKYKEKNMKIINFKHFMNPSVLTKYNDQLNEDEYLLKEIINKGLANIKMAKDKHDTLESFYVSNMDFEKVNEFENKVIEKILKYT